MGPKGSGVGVGVADGRVVGCVVGVIPIVGVFTVVFAVGFNCAVEAVRYANAATRVLHTSTTIAIIRNLPFALFHKAILFSLPNDIMISLADDI
jgi:hypothetical protein